MNEPNDEPRPPEDEAKQVHCRRTGQDYDPEEHARCPYCFGKETQIEGGKHAEFCDYDPKKDPIHFGFRPDSYRQTDG